MSGTEDSGIHDCQNERPRRHVPRYDDESNPKQRYGDMKVALGLMPPSAMILISLAMMQGAQKYGPYNWRKKPVDEMTYFHAALRHLLCWADGEDIDPESNFPHLGHAGACISILIDGTESGTIIRTRPEPGPAGQLLRKWGGFFRRLFS